MDSTRRVSLPVPFEFHDRVAPSGCICFKSLSHPKQRPGRASWRPQIGLRRGWESNGTGRLIEIDRRRGSDWRPRLGIKIKAKLLAEQWAQTEQVAIGATGPTGTTSGPS